jgi:EAL domain-containing protein (putative c-di-GMP-specific phosphodiesterase class I)/GGDEF domain-containing protein
VTAQETLRPSSGEEDPQASLSPESLIEAFPDAVIVLDLERRVVASNSRAREEMVTADARRCGHCREVFVGYDGSCVGHSNGCPFETVVTTGTNVKTVHRIADSSGAFRTVSIEASPVVDERGRIVGMMEVRRDVSSLRDDRAQLEFLRNHDAVTGLLNSSAFLRKVNSLRDDRDHGVPCVGVARIRLLSLDRVVEGFPASALEQLLKVFAERLQAWSILGGVFGFQGNSDFLAALPVANQGSDVDAARHLVASVVRDPIEIDGQDVFIQAMVGVSTRSRRRIDAETMLQEATTGLLRELDRRPRNAPTPSAPATGGYRRIDIEARLRAAVRRGTLGIALQPQYVLSNGHLRGFEALLRWTDENGESVSPTEFVPILEEIELLDDVSLWLIERAMLLLRHLRSRGFLVPLISVNLSASQVSSKTLAERIAEMVGGAGGVHGLELEVTETGLMYNFERSVAFMKRLAVHGITFAVDDFGVGYSSLGYLQRLPVQCVKIDRAFVENLRSSANDHAIVAAVVAMAHSLGLEVVAEGVEHVGQRAVLKQIGADAVQGFLFSEPIPIEQISVYLDGLRRKAPAS